TGRVRHSRRRKAVATEERRIKAIRDQPCPVKLARQRNHIFLNQVFLKKFWIVLLKFIVKEDSKAYNLQSSFFLKHDPYVVFNLGKQVSVSLCDCLLTCIYRLFVDLKSYCHNLLIVQKLQTAIVNSNLNPYGIKNL
ncbi:hypothetical protein HID58_024986, partial [Brassica napus]